MKGSSEVLIVVVEVDTKQEVLQVRLITPVDQLGDNCMGETEKRKPLDVCG